MLFLLQTHFSNQKPKINSKFAGGRGRAHKEKSPAPLLVFCLSTAEVPPSCLCIYGVTVSMIMSALETNTAKYRVVKTHFCKLIRVCERALQTTASYLFQEELITSAANEQASNASHPVSDRSRDLMNEVLKMIELDQKWYDVFLSVLRNLNQTGIDMADELNTALQKERPFTQQCPLTLGHVCSHCCIGATQSRFGHSAVNPEMNSGVSTNEPVSTLNAGDQVNELNEIADQLDTALVKEEGSSNASSLHPQRHPLPPHVRCRHLNSDVVQSKTKLNAESDSGVTTDIQNSTFADGDTVPLQEAELESQQPKLLLPTSDTFAGTRSDYPQEAEITALVFSHSSSDPASANNSPVICSSPPNEVMVPIEHTSNDISMFPPASATISSDNWNRNGENDYLKSQNKKLESKISILNQKIKQLEADLQEKSEEINKLQKDLKEVEKTAQIDSARAAKAMLGKQIEISNLMEKALESKGKELAALMESKEKEQAALGELAALKERCAKEEASRAHEKQRESDLKMQELKIELERIKGSMCKEKNNS